MDRVVSSLSLIKSILESPILLSSFKRLFPNVYLNNKLKRLGEMWLYNEPWLFTIGIFPCTPTMIDHLEAHNAK